MKNIDDLKTKRMNKLIELVSLYDQFGYIPDDRDLKLIDELDADILDANKKRGI